MNIIALDTETYLIGPGQLTPKLVCISVALNDECYLIDAGDANLESSLKRVISDERNLIVGHNIAFDMRVLFNHFPSLRECILDAYWGDRITCTKIREKLYNLATYGELREVAGVAISYSLAELAKTYIGVDLSDEKKNPDAWRFRYAELDGVPASEYPEEAADYAKADAIFTKRIYEAQCNRDFSYPTEFFQARADFCAGLVSSRGVLLDRPRVEALAREVEEELKGGKYQALIDSGILRPAEPPRPYRRGRPRQQLVKWKIKLREFSEFRDTVLQLAARYHYNEELFVEGEEPFFKSRRTSNTGLTKRATNKFFEWLEKKGVRNDRDFDYFKSFRDAPPVGNDTKMTKAKEESLNTKALRAHIESICKKHDIPVEYTPSGEVATDKKFLAELAPHDALISLFMERRKIIVLHTTFLPKLKEGIVYFNFDVLKKTGRLSSHGDEDSDLGQNGQNIDPRVRPCYVARPGSVLVTADYGSMELVTLAWRVKQLFGYSNHLNQIANNISPHDYLGSLIAYRFDPNFASWVSAEWAGDVFRAFCSLKDSNNPAGKEFFKSYRTLAKPTGLGYPGGLGPKKFVSYARNWGLFKTLEEAEALRNVWLEAYPEMADYFRYVNNMTDDLHEDKLMYTSPLGMVRRNCTFAQTANGFGLQTPGAEGMKHAFCWVVRSCFDKELDNILYGCHVLNVVHDEILIEMPDDGYLHERCQHLKQIMEHAFWQVIPEPQIRTEPVAMRRWEKGLDPQYNEFGQLTVIEN